MAMTKATMNLSTFSATEVRRPYGMEMGELYGGVWIFIQLRMNFKVVGIEFIQIGKNYTILKTFLRLHKFESSHLDRRTPNNYTENAVTCTDFHK